MFSQVIKFYLFTSLLLFILFANYVSEYYFPIYVYNFITIFIYGFSLLYIYFQKEQFYKLNLRLFIFIGFYSFISIFVLNTMSYAYTDNFFVFSTADASTYDYIATELRNSDKSFKQVLHQLGYSRLGFDDWGMIYLVYILYHIEESNLVVNFFYWFIGLFSFFYFFGICKNFMNEKYSSLATITFICSSYFQWFNSSGLKESFLVFLVISAFFYYYRFINTRKIKYFIYLLIPLGLIMFFRPAVSLLLIASMGLQFIVQLKMSAFKVFGIISIILSIVLAYGFILEQKNKYVGSDLDTLVETKKSEEMVKGSIPFIYAVNAISSYFGPFPTIITNDAKVQIAFYFPGLYLKILFSFCFALSMYYVFKMKRYDMIAIVAFLFLETMSLILILEALELRKSLPHFMLFYVLIFWFLYQISEHKISKKKVKLYKKVNLITLCICFGLVIYWNFR